MHFYSCKLQVGEFKASYDLGNFTPDFKYTISNLCILMFAVCTTTIKIKIMKKRIRVKKHNHTLDIDTLSLY